MDNTSIALAMCAAAARLSMGTEGDLQAIKEGGLEVTVREEHGMTYLVARHDYDKVVVRVSGGEVTVNGAKGMDRTWTEIATEMLKGF